MRKSLLFPLIVFSLIGMQPAKAKVIHLLPRVHTLVCNEGASFALHRRVKLIDANNTTALRSFLESNGCTIRNAAKATVTVEMVQSIPGAYDYKLNHYENEAYRLIISKNAIKIQAVKPVGVIRAAQTLTQLAEGYAAGHEALEAVDITDWPAFKLRGLMHDVGRSYMEFEELMNEIDKLSRFKVNTFHWHLTELTGWRFQVKRYPQLTEAKYNKRHPGRFYSQDECRRLVAYAKERGITVIPEIDMPGHSEVFTKAMGYDMQSQQGIAALKNILNEVCEVFVDAPYIHIGGDEVRIKDSAYLENMANHIRAKGKKVVMWNRLVAGAPTARQCDMTQMWATAGRHVKGLPNIDCRYNYINHFDVYADLVGIYKSCIYYAKEGSPDIAGTITGIWNDTMVDSDADIVRQNNLYANVLASAERAWIGGGKQYIEKGGVTLPNSGEEFEEFADFERRFLFHKANSLKNEPIAYVKQTNVRWRITEPIPNGGNKAAVFEPETSKADILPDTYTINGQIIGTTIATGAGIYLRHIWHPTVPSYFKNPSNGQTAYAWTYVHSDKAQEVGAQIEFYTYSRSGSERTPLAGQWDRRGSKIWLNDVEIPAPKWVQPDKSIPQNSGNEGLKNENLTARPVVRLSLKAGWNKVLMRLPHVDNGGTARDKWQFTFVLTDTEGRNAAEGIVYSPDKRPNYVP